MTESKHTPGPWKITRALTEERTHTLSIGTPKKFIAVLECYRVDGGPYKMPEDGPANAQLIAAAPELLEALEYLLLDIQGAEELGLPLSAIPSSAESLKDAEAAIRKAKNSRPR